MKQDSLTEFLQNIANAIREKKGTTELINAQNFANEISSLESEGGSIGWIDGAPQKDINFYDYDGKRLYSYSWDELMELSELPPLPSQKGLVCQGWNYTLDDIKNQSHHKCDIGAIYITDDEKTRIYHETAADNTSVTIRYYRRSSGDITVDWGDGTVNTGSGGTGSIKKSHTYAKAGVYIITLEVPEEHGDSQFKEFAGSKLLKVEMGKRMSKIEESATSYEKYIRTITLSNNVNSFSDNNVGVFKGTSRLEALIFPRECNIQYTWLALNSGVKVVSLPPTTTSMDKMFMFKGCNQLYSIVIPQNVTEIGDQSFSNCTNLSDVALPNSITDIGDGAFNGCTNLKQLVFSHFNAVPSISDMSLNAIPDECTSIYVPGNLYSDWIKQWYNYSNKIVMDFEPLEYTGLTITANDVMWYDGATVVNYNVTCNGRTILTGESQEGVVLKGTAISTAFPQNQSLTESAQRDVTFSYMGLTANTSINQGIREASVPNAIVCRYNVTTTSSATKLQYTSFNYFKHMLVDGVQVDYSTTYTFDTTGEHEVVFVLNDGAQPSSFYRIFRDITTLTYVNCETVDMSKAISSSSSSGTAYMFYGCTKLKTIILPSTIKYMGYSMFNSCKAVTRLIIGATTAPTIYDSNTFSNLGSNNKGNGTSIFYIPTGATGYDSSYWTSSLTNASTCDFTKIETDML